MEAFARVLRKAEAGLRVPEPRRSRILLEMATDLEDLYQEYRARGLSEEEARERAVRFLGASPEVLAELAREHGSRMAGFLDRLAGAGGHRLERALLVLTTGVAVAGGAVAVTNAQVVAHSPWSWGLLALFGAGAWAMVAHAIALLVRPERLGARPVEDLRELLGLAGSCLTLGALGGLTTFVRGLVAMGAVHASGPSAEQLWGRVASAAGLSALGLTAALMLSGAWLLLRQRARAIEDARASLRSALSPTVRFSSSSDNPRDAHTPTQEGIR